MTTTPVAHHTCDKYANAEKKPGKGCPGGTKTNAAVSAKLAGSCGLDDESKVVSKPHALRFHVK